ncbi:hypothetical protein Syun_004263 [Stephania yunnanensis]|uniref:Uncharacterized protein n=1 Tax=Stephania yunnanensis TaxID=152371 RepID=A0AAP0Q4S0_9MAGN
MPSCDPLVVRRIVVHLCCRVRVLGVEIFSNLERMARTKNTVMGEEIEAQESKGARGARKSQIASQKNMEEFGSDERANEVGDLHNEAFAASGSNVVGKELAIRTSQVNLVE